MQIFREAKIRFAADSLENQTGNTRFFNDSEFCL